MCILKFKTFFDDLLFYIRRIDPLSFVRFRQATLQELMFNHGC